MKALRLSEFIKLVQVSLEEENPVILSDTAAYVINHYGDDYQEELNSGEYIRTSENKSKAEVLQSAQPTEE